MRRENFNQTEKEAELISKSLPRDFIRAFDKRAKELGLSERVLIENASSNLYEVINRLNLGRKVLVIAGRGNNGADVLSCARKLSSRGYDVNVAVLEEKELNQEALIQKDILEKIKLPIYSIKRGNCNQLEKLIKDRDFILEGILGIGLRGEVSAHLKKIISLINNSGKDVVSCDIPSGLSSDEGIPQGCAIKADYTITFLAPKKGFFLNQGRDFCGKIFVVDIGISREVLERGGVR